MLSFMHRINNYVKFVGTVVVIEVFKYSRVNSAFHPFIEIRQVFETASNQMKTTQDLTNSLRHLFFLLLFALSLQICHTYKIKLFKLYNCLFGCYKYLLTRSNYDILSLDNSKLYI